MASVIQAVRGMNDVLPDAAPLWQRFDDAVRDVVRAVRLSPHPQVPLVEPTPLFVRAIGEVTDIVEKEMYTFDDRLNGESLTLRPEATAGIVRAAIEHNLAYERPAARVDHGPDVPPRTSAEGPLPPVPPVRRRGAGLRRPGRRRRADRDARAACGASWASTASSLQINTIGDPTNAARIAQTLVAYFSANTDHARRRFAAPPAHQSAAHSR